MSFNPAILPILILMVISVITVSIVMRVLSKEVSREKLHKVQDLSVLWKTSFPPSEVLTERGLKIQKWYRVFIVVLILGCAVFGFFVTGFSNAPITNT